MPSIAGKLTILLHHLVPRFGDKKLDAIKNEDVQRRKAAPSGKAAKTVIGQQLGPIHLAQKCSNRSNGWVVVQIRYRSTVAFRARLSLLSRLGNRDLQVQRDWCGGSEPGLLSVPHGTGH